MKKSISKGISKLKLLSPKHKTRASSKTEIDDLSHNSDFDNHNSDSSDTDSDTSIQTICDASGSDGSRSDRPTDQDSRLQRIEDIVVNITPTLQKEIQKLRSSQEKKFSKIKKSLTTIEHDVQAVQTENIALKAANQRLTNRLNSLEAYSRRSNLIIHNVPEDMAPLINTTRRILTAMGIDNPDKISFEAIHRIGSANRQTQNHYSWHCLIDMTEIASGLPSVISKVLITD